MRCRETETYQGICYNDSKGSLIVTRDRLTFWPYKDDEDIEVEDFDDADFPMGVFLGSGSTSWLWRAMDHAKQVDAVAPDVVVGKDSPRFTWSQPKTMLQFHVYKSNKVYQVSLSLPESSAKRLLREMEHRMSKYADVPTTGTVPARRRRLTEFTASQTGGALLDLRECEPRKGVMKMKSACHYHDWPHFEAAVEAGRAAASEGRCSDSPKARPRGIPRRETQIQSSFLIPTSRSQHHQRSVPHEEEQEQEQDSSEEWGSKHKQKQQLNCQEESHAHPVSTQTSATSEDAFSTITTSEHRRASSSHLDESPCCPVTDAAPSKITFRDSSPPPRKTRCSETTKPGARRSGVPSGRPTKQRPLFDFLRQPAHNPPMFLHKKKKAIQENKDKRQQQKSYMAEHSHKSSSSHKRYSFIGAVWLASSNYYATKIMGDSSSNDPTEDTAAEDNNFA